MAARVPYRSEQIPNAKRFGRCDGEIVAYSHQSGVFAERSWTGAALHPIVIMQN